jgi:putative transposase
VFEAEGIAVVLTRRHTPQAYAIAERWIRSVREEALDHIIVLGQRHLHRVLVENVDFYNWARPRQGIEQQTPIPRLACTREQSIGRRDVLGGVLKVYYRRVA